MAKNSKEFLVATEKLSKKIKALQQQLKHAKETIEAIKRGTIDAVVISDKKKLKVFTGATADKKYRILIEKMHEGTVVITKTGIILYCNSHFAAMVNLPLHQVIGSKFENFIIDASEKHVSGLLKKGWTRYSQNEISIYKKGKKSMPVLMSLNAIVWDNTPVLSITLTDLTIQNENREELKEKAKQLEQKNTELKTVIKKLAVQNKKKEKKTIELTAANKDLTTFTYVSSHDLQEPLRKIQNFVTCILLEEGNLSETSRDYFLRMRTSAKRMQELIDDLLTYSRSKDNKQNFENTDLNTILNDVKNDFEETLQEKEATIKVSDLCEIPVIRTQFRQVIQNLISNSLKFSKAHTPLQIRISSKIEQRSRKNDKIAASKIKYCHLTYTDNGIGFDPQYNERIFEVFQRLHSQEEYSGTGIGLAICKRIIENHNGTITATGEPGKGARFDLFIPSITKRKD